MKALKDLVMNPIPGPVLVSNSVPGNASLRTSLTGRPVNQLRVGMFATSVHIGIATLLLTSGILQIERAAHDPREALFYVLLDAIKVFFLATLGALLVFGPLPRFTHRLTIATFFGFAIYNLHAIFFAAADRSCDCFGRLHVDPRFAFAIDVFAVLSLLGAGSGAANVRDARFLHRGLIASAAIGVLAGTVSLMLGLVGHARSFGETTVKKPEVYLRPKEWAYQRLPVLDALKCDRDVSVGEWTMVFWDASCGTCRDKLPEYASMAARHNLVLVTTREPPSPRPHANSKLVWARLAHDRTWWVATPTEIDLSNGVVTRVD